jgi:hypothetical protein
MGGQALSPPSSCQCFVFHIRLKEFSRTEIFNEFYIFYSAIFFGFENALNFFALPEPAQSQDQVRNERAGKIILFKTGGGVIYQGQGRCMS